MYWHKDFRQLICAKFFSISSRGALAKRTQTSDLNELKNEDSFLAVSTHNFVDWKDR